MARRRIGQWTFGFGDGAIGHRPPQEMQDAFHASINALDKVA